MKMFIVSYNDIVVNRKLSNEKDGANLSVTLIFKLHDILWTLEQNIFYKNCALRQTSSFTIEHVKSILYLPKPKADAKNILFRAMRDNSGRNKKVPKKSANPCTIKSNFVTVLTNSTLFHLHYI